MDIDFNLDDLLDIIHPPLIDITDNNAVNEVEIIIEPFCTNERKGRCHVFLFDPQFFIKFLGL